RDGFQLRVRLAITSAVDQREWYVVRIGGQDTCGGLIDSVLAVGPLGRGREIAERAQPALADDLLGGLDHRAEDPADLPALDVDGAVGEREVGLFRIPAIDVEQQITRAG